MRLVLLWLALVTGGWAAPPESTPPLLLPEPVSAPRDPVELRWDQDQSALPVNSGTQIAGQVRGAMAIPATDPGRTLIQVELVFPLLSRNGRSTLLPVGTRLVGQVHVLRGEYRFVAFQSLLLPNGRQYSLSEEVFRLGPGRILATQDGTPVMVTVSRPLRMEPLG